MTVTLLHTDPVDDLMTRARLATSELERSLLEEEIAAALVPWVERLADRYRGRGVEVDELRGVARLALVSAMRRFDPEAGEVRAYVKATVLGEIKRYFRDRAWAVRPTRSVVETRDAVMACREERVLQGLPVSDRDVAAALGIEVAAVREADALVDLFAPDSLDAPGADVVDQRDSFEEVLDWDLLGRCARDLGPTDRQLIKLRYFDELSQAQIGQLLGVSQMQVSRLLKRLIERLRAASTPPRTPQAA